MPSRFSLKTFIAAAALGVTATAASALSCGNDGSGFNAWKQEFAAVAQQNGVGQRGLQALANSTYSQATINADRNQRGVRYSLNDFIRIRLGSVEGIAAQARQRLNQNRAFFDSLERAYGVPPGPLLAIHAMETGFGRNMGNENVVSSILTVAYDCRRANFFIPHAIAALQLVDRGIMSPNQRGAAHGEIGHTQFLPGNAIRFGADGNGDGVADLTNYADAMASTANFLRAHGWRPGVSYQEGQPNFRVLNEWNAATVYQQAIALVGAAIDG